MLRTAVAVTVTLIAGTFMPWSASAQQPIDWDKNLNLGGPVSGPLMVLHEVEELSLFVVSGTYASGLAAGHLELQTAGIL